MMEGEQDLSPPTTNVDTSRPSLGFPLGTSLLLIIIFTLSGIFSCCYHRDKFRSLQTSLIQSNSTPTPTPTHHSSSPNSNTELKQNKGQSMPVLMPGDDVPKFIATPCPCQPSLPERIIVTVEKPPATQNHRECQCLCIN
ncbi:hypothetical protein Lal_00007390 [Lupinus albus]|uniref:Uncharacterized protein n=1 Tax=Lupinus albus TaxID=3870 RepID=A0A6A4P600_LUPAL|nr:hypothetical protein Lalb_Chr16g0381451 [Lupinus albus]KAF1874776.1 hypothetical protein Lal_00007390 [Lupinus albus]